MIEDDKLPASGTEGTSDGNVEVPPEENVDQRIRTLDEVTEEFYKDNLLGPNTYRDVKNAKQLAEQGKTLSHGKGKGPQHGL